MVFRDWMVIFFILALSLGLGLAFSRSARKGGTLAYFSAGRKLPWWAVGLSNTATYQSGAGGFVMLILSFGLMGNWLWWGSWIIWMPLVAIIWAPLWRRMNISTTAELISLRYGGKKAIWARKSYAMVSAFGFAVLLIGYITGFFVKTLAPIIELTEFQVILVLGGITVIYTLFGGLAGVAYVDVFQFFIMLAGSFVFMFLALQDQGGLTAVIDQIAAVRPEALKMIPPGDSFPLPLLIILMIQGLFFAGSPTAGEGSTAQRFMAARSEKAAMTGQLFNTFLALSLRTIPIIGIGLVSILIFSKPSPGGGFELLLDDPVHAWGMLINYLELSPGLKGLLVAIEVVAYVSTLSTLINWGSSFVVNDLLPQKVIQNPDQQIMAGRLTTLLLFLLAGLTAVLFVDNMISWFVFINSAMVIFLLPLSWFRFFWWRFNAWGELAAILLGLPLSVIVWFVLDYQNKSMWQGLAILLTASLVVLIGITWLTKPEPREVLQTFYRRCHPAGWWRGIRPESERRSMEKATKKMLIQSVLGIVSALGLVLFTNAMFSGQAVVMIPGIILTLTGGILLIRSLSGRKK